MNFDEADFARFQLRAGDVLINEGSGSATEVGKPAIWKGEIADCCFQNTLLRVQPTACTSDFVYNYIKFCARGGGFVASTQGVSIYHIGREGLAKYPVPVAPLPEQQRIVSRIHSLSAKSKNARNHLDNAANLVEKYRKAILRAAFGGKITKEWRGPQVRERSASTKLPAEFRNANLPDTWETTPLDRAVHNHDARRIPLKKDDRVKRQGAYPYYGASGIIDHIDDYIYDGKYLLIAEDGANLLSRSTSIAFTAMGKFWVNNHAHIVQPNENYDHDFIRYYIESVDLRPYVTGSAQPKLTQGAFERIFVVCPPRNEQIEIVRRIENALAWIDRLAAEATSARKLIAHLDQAVLSKAFCGGLVPQDPNDEPASVLLERIKGEKNGAVQPRRGRGRPPSVARF
ncbi:restriction endonuclease subunit S [Methylobacterium cerastii]|nr:restriction endonuclease subunit S [Methylobacterium cerastii]